MLSHRLVLLSFAVVLLLAVAQGRGVVSDDGPVVVVASSGNCEDASVFDERIAFFSNASGVPHLFAATRARPHAHTQLTGTADADYYPNFQNGTRLVFFRIAREPPHPASVLLLDTAANQTTLLVPNAYLPTASARFLAFVNVSSGQVCAAPFAVDAAAPALDRTACFGGGTNPWVSGDVLLWNSDAGMAALRYASWAGDTTGWTPPRDMPQLEGVPAGSALAYPALSANLLLTFTSTALSPTGDVAVVKLAWDADGRLEQTSSVRFLTNSSALPTYFGRLSADGAWFTYVQAKSANSSEHEVLLAEL